MKIIDKLKNTKISISFEFFPPKTEEAEKTLFETISNLQPLNPTLCLSHMERVVQREKRQET